MTGRYPLTAACFAACVAAGYAAEPVVIHQKSLQFSQTDLMLARGQTVVFKNEDRTSHNITVTGAGIALDGGLQPSGVDYAVPFIKAGSYVVSCGIHPKMKLTVTVK